MENQNWIYRNLKSYFFGAALGALSYLTVYLMAPAIFPEGLKLNAPEENIEEQLEAQKKPKMLLPNESQLAGLIASAASKHDLESSRLSCIFKIESNYRMGVISDTQDFGIGQINEVTIKHYKLDKELLLTDSTYAIEATAKLLKQLKTQLKPDFERQWPCAYNIGVSGLLRGRKGAACEAYLEKLNACIISGDYL